MFYWPKDHPRNMGEYVVGHRIRTPGPHPPPAPTPAPAKLATVICKCHGHGTCHHQCKPTMPQRRVPVHVDDFDTTDDESDRSAKKAPVKLKPVLKKTSSEDLKDDCKSKKRDVDECECKACLLRVVEELKVEKSIKHVSFDSK